MAIVPLEKEQLIYIGFLSQQCGSRTSTEGMHPGFNCAYRGNPDEHNAECYPPNCPIARPATLADLQRFKPDLYDKYKGRFGPTEVPDPNYMVQHSRFDR